MKTQQRAHRSRPSLPNRTALAAAPLPTPLRVLRIVAAAGGVMRNFGVTHRSRLFMWDVYTYTRPLSEKQNKWLRDIESAVFGCVSTTTQAAKRKKPCASNLDRHGS